MTDHLDTLEDYETTSSGIHEAMDDIEDAVVELTDYLSDKK